MGATSDPVTSFDETISQLQTHTPTTFPLNEAAACISDWVAFLTPFTDTNLVAINAQLTQLLTMMQNNQMGNATQVKEVLTNLVKAVQHLADITPDDSGKQPVVDPTTGANRPRKKRISDLAAILSTYSN
jgi:hypothetical protein